MPPSPSLTGWKAVLLGKSITCPLYTCNTHTCEDEIYGCLTRNENMCLSLTGGMRNLNSGAQLPGPGPVLTPAATALRVGRVVGGSQTKEQENWKIILVAWAFW